MRMHLYKDKQDYYPTSRFYTGRFIRKNFPLHSLFYVEHIDTGTHVNTIISTWRKQTNSRHWLVYDPHDHQHIA